MLNVVERTTRLGEFTDRASGKVEETGGTGPSF
jgi:hypothetical protein